MTATQVDDVPVLADEPTRSPMTSRRGTPVYWTQVRTLLLEDESIVYGCVHCDHTDPSKYMIVGHLNSVHTERKPRAKRGAKRGAGRNEDLSVSELLTKLGKLAAIEADRDAWKSRAMKAERELATVRRVLGGARPPIKPS